MKKKIRCLIKFVIEIIEKLPTSSLERRVQRAPFQKLSKNCQLMFMLSSTQQDRRQESIMAQSKYINYQ